MLRPFQDSFIFGEATSYFFRVTTSTQQLLFRISYFFRAAAFFFEELFFQNSHFFRSSYFFRKATFSERNFYPAATFWEWKFFRAVTFQNSYLLAEELFRIKISTEELPFRSRYFCTASNFIRKDTFWKKLIFQKSNIPHYFFWRATFLIAATFSEELLFYNILIQKSYYFAAT